MGNTTAINQAYSSLPLNPTATPALVEPATDLEMSHALSVHETEADSYANCYFQRR
jgi:hypothetical protein